MTKIAIFKFEEDGFVTGILTDASNDIEANALITESGNYAFIDVHYVDRGEAPKKAASKKAASKKGK